MKKRYWNTRAKDADTEGADAPSLHQSRSPCGKFYNRPLYFSETMKYNEVNDKLEFYSEVKKVELC